jgi:hypothetical protein
MEAEWIAAAVLIAVLTPAFGRFETIRPLWTRVARWLIVLAVLFALQHTAGRPWTFLWLLGLPAMGAAFHFSWCRRNGINPITAEPWDRYVALRTRRDPAVDRGS